MSSSRRLAAAFDLGTTTIAASLVDPASGERLARTGALNPQRAFGADVLTRLTAAADSERLRAMQGCLALEMERLTDELLALAGAAPAELAQVAVAGNPAMEHIALALPVASLAYPPFRPLFTAGKTVTTLDLGWKRELPAYLLPLPGGFVGGDLVAFLFGLAEEPAMGTLYLDMGTNAEIALFDGERFLATSAAAGPAFEGGNLRCGMSALPGAVSGVSIDGDRLLLSTIAGATPRGICGSGVLETVAALLEAGIIEPAGRIRPAAEIDSNLGNRVQEVNGIPAFVLHRDASGSVFLDQEDVRALQLAKGALRGGMEILMGKAGLSADDLSRVVLTGSFGAVLSPEVLKKVGIFNEKMVRITGFIKEGALAGVERMLLLKDGRDQMEDLAQKVRVIPLSGTPLFEKHFLANVDFPKT
ncbi:ferredoxin [Geoanaerobacter pelophilus]|uniref:Ferredoxin n=1 Tax=Geoanaerobacter pelophilus TaxID=60036 RepID=A0ABQ0MP75_9BACT|nr:ASKHA domain-containing protein [Geoanaerobacter pelophilus]GAW68869.1 ferredoxin [Geoanaerobacter pelophilus]